MKFFKSFIIFSLIYFINCTTTPLPAILFTKTTQNLPYQANNYLTSAEIKKKGQACAMSVLWLGLLFFAGNESIEKAMQNGNIKKVAVIDSESTILLSGLFVKECTIV